MGLIAAKFLITAVGIRIESVGNGVANQAIPPGQRGFVGSPPLKPWSARLVHGDRRLSSGFSSGPRCRTGVSRDLFSFCVRC
jgi:hypothetical protein